MSHIISAIFLLLSLVSASHCDNSAGWCPSRGEDETSLFQIAHSVQLGSKRLESADSSSFIGKLNDKHDVSVSQQTLAAKKAFDSKTPSSVATQIPAAQVADVLKRVVKAAVKRTSEAAAAPAQKSSAAGVEASAAQQHVEHDGRLQSLLKTPLPSIAVPRQVVMPSLVVPPAMRVQSVPGVPPSLALTLPHAPQVGQSPAVAYPSPRRAEELASRREDLAQKAMEDAVITAHSEERAAMFASRKAAELRVAAGRAAAAETAAAQSQIDAANSAQNAAVRRATAQRMRAQVSAVKAAVQKAAAYKASADQQTAAQNAAAARTAAETARSGLYRFGGAVSPRDREFRDDERYGDRDEYDRERFDDPEDRDRYDERDGFGGERDDEGGYEDRDGGQRYDGGEDMDRDLEYPDDEYGEFRHRHHRQRTCASFTCPDPMRLRLEPDLLPCPRLRGCSVAQCCLEQATCVNFVCNAPLTLRLQPETFQCDASGCIEATCCITAGGAGVNYPGAGTLPAAGSAPLPAVAGSALPPMSSFPTGAAGGMVGGTAGMAGVPGPAAGMVGGGAGMFGGMVGGTAGMAGVPGPATGMVGGGAGMFGGVGASIGNQFPIGA